MNTQAYAACLLTVVLLSNSVNCAFAQDAAPAAAKVTTVQAILNVDVEEDSILPNLKRPFDLGQFQTFTNNQVVLIKSQFVIKAALAPRGIAGLDLVQSQRNKYEWLSKSLEVRNPPGTSLIVLTLRSPGDQNELKTVLDSVVSAYQTEVVAADMIAHAEQRRSAEEFIKGLEAEFGKLVERQLALSAELKDEAGSAEMRLLEIKIEVLEGLLKDNERAAFYSDLRNATGNSRVTIVQSAMAVPDP